MGPKDKSEHIHKVTQSMEAPAPATKTAKAMHADNQTEVEATAQKKSVPSLSTSVELSQASGGDLAARSDSDLDSTEPMQAAEAKMAWQTAAEEPDGNVSIKKRPAYKSTPTLLFSSIGLAMIWVAGVGHYIVQNINTLKTDEATMLVSFAVLLFGPVFALLSGLLGESLAKSQRESKLLLTAVRRLLHPNHVAEGAIRSTAQAVQGEIGRLEAALDQVEERLAQIETHVDQRTKALNQAGEIARHSAQSLVVTMEQERDHLKQVLASWSEITTLAATTTAQATVDLDQRAARLTEVAQSLAVQSSQVSELAAGSAERLDLAAGRATSAIADLDSAAMRGEAALTRAHDLMFLARMRADEAITSLETAVQSLNQAATGASQSAREASATIVGQAKETRDLSLATLDDVRTTAEANARAVVEALRAEAAAARLAGEETLKSLKASGEVMRETAEEARERASQQVIENQQRLEQARQTAFDVGHAADEFLESRVKEAQALIEQSSGLLDQTGVRIQERFSALAAACADQARSVEDVLDAMDRRLDQLPLEAEARAHAIETALNETLARLNAAGRKAADETAALDEAFQVRLRDSYAALAEVVHRLGGLSSVMAPIGLGGAQSASTLTAMQTAPSVPPQPEVSPPNPMGSSSLGSSPTDTHISTPNTYRPPDGLNAGTPSLRGRLAISSPIPLEEDPFAELQTDRNAAANSGRKGNWSWKQVLSTLDSKDGSTETSMVSALVSDLGLDLSLNETALEELNGLASRSRDQARRAVRNIIPTKVLAMRHRLSSDTDLRGAIVRFVEARREAASRGRLRDHEARLYFTADAALEA
ncbi:polar localization protein tipN [Candidatus Phycosocius spiralis]|uniref:Polar localization protein tipN n=1 Tax=Candidatus Phycosocius spiralis TaxID=2815099 RepID=A0ABQ4PXF7_9PROT|nr:polar localization protein tipN [Candidatus Phycosocius spiralis]